MRRQPRNFPDADEVRDYTAAVMKRRANAIFAALFGAPPIGSKARTTKQLNRYAICRWLAEQEDLPLELED